MASFAVWIETDSQALFGASDPGPAVDGWRGVVCVLRTRTLAEGCGGWGRCWDPGASSWPPPARLAPPGIQGPSCSTEKPSLPAGPSSLTPCDLRAKPSLPGPPAPPEPQIQPDPALLGASLVLQKPELWASHSGLGLEGPFRSLLPAVHPAQPPRGPSLHSLFPWAHPCLCTCLQPTLSQPP